MTTDWKELTRIAGGDSIIIERVKLPARDISIEGDFELPPLARLTMEDQVFVAMFVHCHGSIKEVEQIFGVSYPTIKNRLNRIAEQLEVARIDTVQPKNEVLEQLERGEITVDEALKRLKG
ncbi:MAG: DUF2089 domain-containing protein [Candidatus Zixiibacteriota bacterium]|nr:MAG: DUF2089 domain-containing protein [candidate division Zixibacteria bacterium]